MKKGVPPGLQRFNSKSEPTIAFIAYWINSIWIIALLMLLPVGLPILLQGIFTPKPIYTTWGALWLGSFILLMIGVPVALGLIGASLGCASVFIRQAWNRVVVYNGDIYYRKLLWAEIGHQDILKAEIVEVPFYKRAFFKYGNSGLTPLLAKKYVRLKVRSRSKFPSIVSIYPRNRRIAYVYLSVDDPKGFLHSISPVDRSRTGGSKRYLGKKKKKKTKQADHFGFKDSKALTILIIGLAILSYGVLGVILIFLVLPLFSFIFLFFMGISIFFIALKAPYLAVLFLPVSFIIVYCVLLILWIYITGIKHTARQLRIKKEDYLVTVDKNHVVVEYVDRLLLEKRELGIPIESIEHMRPVGMFHRGRFNLLKDRWIRTKNSTRYVRIETYHTKTILPFDSRVVILPVDDRSGFIDAVEERMKSRK